MFYSLSFQWSVSTIIQNYSHILNYEDFFIQLNLVAARGFVTVKTSPQKTSKQKLMYY